VKTLPTRDTTAFARRSTLVAVPALVCGSVLLWRQDPPGYVVAAGPLLQFGPTPPGLAAILAFQRL
jgi:hypothetical protein